MNHSNEPWNRGIGNEAHYVYGTKGELIADTFKGFANGTRMVAAVNHTEGYTNSQLKAVSLKDLHAILLDLRIGIDHNERDPANRIETGSLDRILTKLESTETQS